jgi:lipopolysaccharide transport system ATP-binding protein
LAAVTAKDYSSDGLPELGDDEMWALRGVSFEVEQGEILGMIGRNGAGKSTLLKILSRVTAPTKGEVRIKGRIVSLLEVGTGFHGELTGRENVFLNGAILGMTKAEIRKKFDEIVDFAGVERYMDTPVKRYSSGMYVRLAFAVAAHLDPEILILDEVLAVGDAEFQKKCLGKIRSVAEEGRSVIFVSHNMNAVANLCRSAIALEAGRILDAGPADLQVSGYLSNLRQAAKLSLKDRHDREGDGSVRLTNLTFLDDFGHSVNHLFSGQVVRVRLHYAAERVGVYPIVALSCFSANGEKVFHLDNKITGAKLTPTKSEGTYECKISKLPLPPGQYHFNAMIKLNGTIADHVYAAATVEVLPADFYGIGVATSSHGGLVFADHSWS